MKHTVWIFALAFIVSGCASAALKKQWKEDRGYSDAEIALAEPKSKEFNGVIMMGGGGPFTMGASVVGTVAAQERIRRIYCNCVKKLGPKCQRSPASLSAEDREVWVDGNAAELSLVSNTGVACFPSECQ